jgi:carboxylate-amine ligase
MEGKLTGMLDTRLKYYKTNQARIPSITGKVIPEAIFSKRNYLNTIYEKIKGDIAPFNKDNILNPIWVNSRGAIPRFDRGSIEIRLMDIQECPTADMAIISLVIETIKAFVSEKFIGLDEQMKMKTDPMASLFEKCMVNGQKTEVDSPELLKAVGVEGGPTSAKEVWKTVMDKMVKSGNSALERWTPELSVVLNEGTLADRILNALGEDHSEESIKHVYRKLCGCLEQNKMFIP